MSLSRWWECFEGPMVDLGYLQGKVNLQGLSPMFPWGLVVPWKPPERAVSPSQSLLCVSVLVQ